MSERTLSTSPWRKSSRSNGNGGNNCVEVALLESVIAVRDSKNPSGPALAFSPVQWNAFLDGTKGGTFDFGN